LNFTAAASIIALNVTSNTHLLKCRALPSQTSLLLLHPFLLCRQSFTFLPQPCHAGVCLARQCCHVSSRSRRCCCQAVVDGFLSCLASLDLLAQVLAKFQLLPV
jgi:hypothetical protein